jgi:hypothetical protein
MGLHGSLVSGGPAEPSSFLWHFNLKTGKKITGPVRTVAPVRPPNNGYKMPNPTKCPTQASSQGTLGLTSPWGQENPRRSQPQSLRSPGPSLIPRRVALKWQPSPLNTPRAIYTPLPGAGLPLSVCVSLPVARTPA